MLSLARHGGFTPDWQGSGLTAASRFIVHEADRLAGADRLADAAGDADSRIDHGLCLAFTDRPDFAPGDAGPAENARTVDDMGHGMLFSGSMGKFRSGAAALFRNFPMIDAGQQC
jgi:hypothetical protein